MTADDAPCVLTHHHEWETGRVPGAPAAVDRLRSEQAGLRRVATLAAGRPVASAVFAAVTEEVRRLLGAAGARMLRYEPDGSATPVAWSDAPGTQLPRVTHWTLEGDNVPSRVWRGGRPARMDGFMHASGRLAAFLRDNGVHSAVGAPIVVEGRLWGVMVAVSIANEPLPLDAELRLSGFTELAAAAIACANTNDELAASRARIVAASDQARRRIERNLHDGIQQRLISITLMLKRTMREDLTAESHRARSRLSEVARDLEEAMTDLQETARGIHPPILTQGGLGPAIRSLACRSPVPVELDVRVPERLPEVTEVTAYYVVAEALANTAKHANATVAWVRAEIQAGHLQLSVRDDGVGGLDPQAGSGLIGLVDRVESTGGTLAISGPAGGGASLRVDLPFAPKPGR
jgi:signal transduction histidine kinase